MSKRRCVIALLLALCAGSASAEKRYIVRDVLGLPALSTTCAILGCQVERGLGDPLGQVFLVTTPIETNAVTFVVSLLGQLGIVDAEVDQPAALRDAAADEAPPALYDDQPIDYYGATVWNGYATQPAVDLVRRPAVVNAWGLAGAGTVAIIDTGVDPQHPALASVLVPGYDFTRNQAGGSEMADVDQRTAAVVDGAAPAYVNQRTIAVVDQRTAAVVDDESLRAFGHGTMVAGIVHLVAPRASILPLKAFNADGSGYASDVIRAIHYAVGKNARVINMSFSFAEPSTEVRKATEFATSKKVICIAAAGNDDAATLVYPAALANVTGVASTTDADTRSSFSNYGPSLVWLAAPGEGIVTTYPWGTYAAGWGTSFSTPFVAGAAALMLQVSSTLDQGKADSALGNALFISNELNHGRLDLYTALAAWRSAAGQH
jgi:subtilisin family serine protease